MLLLQAGPSGAATPCSIDKLSKGPVLKWERNTTLEGLQGECGGVDGCIGHNNTRTECPCQRRAWNSRFSTFDRS